MEQPVETRLAMRVSVISIAVNLLLSGLKLTAGLFASSDAMISDAVHSASDVFSTVIVMIGVRISSRKSDQNHPYGHERFECAASLVLASILMMTGFGIGMSGLKQILHGNYGALSTPGQLALIAAVISILTKEWMYWYTRSAARKLNFGALMADAWHHRSDALSSIGAFIGIFGSRHGFPVMDSIASVVICLFILKAAIDIFKDALDKMVDTSCDPETIDRMADIVTGCSGVERIDSIRTRLFASKAYVDIEIAVDENMPLIDAHRIAENVHDRIEQTFPQVKHCMVHVNPFHP